jgi:hypothetical protein
MSEGERAWRASSERALPVEVPRMAAISLAAKRTSSSMFSVVRIGEANRITHPVSEVLPGGERRGRARPTSAAAAVALAIAAIAMVIAAVALA